MKPTLVVIALHFCATLSAQAPEPAHLPGEPHHHLKIDNSFVRAYYVEVAPHDETQLHQHDHDYIFVSLGPGDVINAVRDKPEAHLVLKDGEVHFSRGGFAHVARNLSDKPFRNVTLELLMPQGEPHNLCLKIVDAPLGTCHAHRASSDLLDIKMVPAFETEEVHVDLVQMGNQGFSLGAVPKLSRLVVALTGAFLEAEVGGQPPLAIRPGDAVWLPAGVTSRISAAPGF